jgi:hypothetical protein
MSDNSENSSDIYVDMTQDKVEIYMYDNVTVYKKNHFSIYVPVLYL